MNKAPYLFSDNERTLLEALTREGVRPQDIIRQTRIPNASAYLAFKKLQNRGFAIKHKEGHRVFWRCTDSFLNTKTQKNSDVAVYTSKVSIKEKIYSMFNLEKGERVFILEGKQIDSGWFDLFSKKETMELNKLLLNRKIVSETFLPESFFSEAVKYLGEDWKSSFQTRPLVTNFVDDGTINSNAILILTRKSVLFIYAKKPIAIEIKNKEIILLLRGFIEVIRTARK